MPITPSILSASFAPLLLTLLPLACGDSGVDYPATGGASSYSATGGASTALPGTGGESSDAAAPAAALPRLHTEGNQLKDTAGNSVVLRGISTVDLGATDSWYGGAIEMIDRLTSANDPSGSSPGWYTRVIRLAIYPHDSPDTDSPNTWQPGSEAFYQNLLRPVVDRCKERGVYAIIDWHYIDTTSLHRDTTTEFWTYMAPKFAADPHVLYELYNEPINGGDWTSVREDMQNWYEVVRAAAPDSLVLIGTPNWCQLVGATATAPLDGTNIAYTAHMYPMHWASQNLQQEIVTAAAAHPVFLTEWGFEENADDIVDGTITSYGAPFKAFVEQHRLSWTAWCANYEWFPAMFDPGYVLAVGEGRMGGFAKDWLYEKRDDDQPQ